MGIGEGPLFPWILEGDGFVEHVLERDLHRVPYLIEQRGLEDLLYQCGHTHVRFLPPLTPFRSSRGSA